VTTYAYNALDKLVRIDFADGSYSAYGYDVFGRRVERDVNGTLTRYVYDGDNILLEFDGTGNLQARYGHGRGTDQPLVMERGGARFFYHADHLGSIRLVTDGVGTIVNRYDYDSSGSFETRTEAVVNPFTFTGREFDAESGLYYYRARYYDPATGRFLSRDPIGFASGDLNLYRYAFNNPVNLVDPFGLVVASDYARLGLVAAGAAGVAGAAGYSTGGQNSGLGSSIASIFQNIADLLSGISILASGSGGGSEGGSGTGTGGGSGADEGAPEGDEASPSNPAGPAADGDAPSAQPGAEKQDLGHSEEREALNDLIKELTRGDRKWTNEEADAILDLGRDLGIDVRDNRGESHWKGGSHIHVPQSGINHIPVRSD
jgi:RHS repeat-associated protein